MASTTSNGCPFFVWTTLTKASQRRAMENTNNIINEPNVKAANGWKIATIVLTIIVLCLGGILTLTVISKNDELQKSQDLLAAQEAKQKESADKTNTTEVPEQKPVEELPDEPTATAPTAPAPDVNEGYLIIKEWGVKVKMRDADKVTYEMVSSNAAKPIIKPNVRQDARCKNDDLGLALLRYKFNNLPEAYKGEYPAKKAIDTYIYVEEGAPGIVCPYNKDDGALEERVLLDFNILNIEKL
jgi:hypothetical protein